VARDRKADASSFVCTLCSGSCVVRDKKAESSCSEFFLLAGSSEVSVALLHAAKANVEINTINNEFFITPPIGISAPFYHCLLISTIIRPGESVSLVNAWVCFYQDNKNTTHINMG